MIGSRCAIAGIGKQLHGPRSRIGTLHHVICKHRARGQNADRRRLTLLFTDDLDNARAGNAHIGRNVIEQRAIEKAEGIDTCRGDVDGAREGTRRRAQTDKGIICDLTTRVDGNVENVFGVSIARGVRTRVTDEVCDGVNVIRLLRLGGKRRGPCRKPH